MLICRNAKGVRGQRKVGYPCYNSTALRLKKHVSTRGFQIYSFTWLHYNIWDGCNRYLS